jgi:hypothetical protein
MNLLKIGVRFWITITSVLSFLTGWVMLAHAPKPDQAKSLASNASVTVPTLEPLQPLSTFGSDDNGFQSQQPFFSVEPSTRSQFRPSFKTGGS